MIIISIIIIIINIVIVIITYFLYFVAQYTFKQIENFKFFPNVYNSLSRAYSG